MIENLLSSSPSDLETIDKVSSRVTSPVDLSDSCSADNESNESGSNTQIDDSHSSPTLIRTTTTKTSSQTTSSSSSSEQTTDELLRLLLFKVDAIENYLIKLDVKMDHFRSSGPVSEEATSGMADMGKLRELGLPVEDLIGLQQLEQRLKENGFKSKLVSKNTKFRPCFAIYSTF